MKGMNLYSQKSLEVNDLSPASFGAGLLGDAAISPSHSNGNTNIYIFNSAYDTGNPF